MTEEEMPRNARFGDYSPIPDRDLQQIREAYNQSKLVFPWRAGDVLLLDNMRMAHGRLPYTGPREVAVCMAGPISARELTAVGN